MLAIKCLLKTQIYGSFGFTMTLPLMGLVLVCYILIPTTLARRLCEKRKRKRDQKRHDLRLALALHDMDPPAFTPPRFEPRADCSKACGGFANKAQLKIPCCREPASEHYITKAHRKSIGELPQAPDFRPCCNVHERVLMGIPRGLLLACKICRVPMKDEEKGVWRAERALKMQRDSFKPMRRLTAVMVLLMYSLYPTLVASTTSIFNCTNPIAGKRYLVADLTVTCYEGWCVCLRTSPLFLFSLVSFFTPASILI